MKLFLIDAYALIYRSYYAFIKNPRINSKGLNTSAIFGFTNSLEDVTRRENPTHIAIAFDPKGSTFRHEIYEPYKAQREETPEDIRKSIPISKNSSRHTISPSWKSRITKQMMSSAPLPIKPPKKGLTFI